MKYSEKLWRIEFDSKPVYGDNNKYMETKIKTWWQCKYKFSSKEMPKEKVPIIMLDSIVKTKKVLSTNTFGGVQI